jgi:hypothetical protein
MVPFNCTVDFVKDENDVPRMRAEVLVLDFGRETS